VTDVKRRGEKMTRRINVYDQRDVRTGERQAMWREHPFLTTTATQLGRGLTYGGCTEIQG
jgi:hypothetical protein